MFIREKTLQYEVKTDVKGVVTSRHISKIHLSTNQGQFIIARRSPTDERWLKIHRQTRRLSHVNPVTVALIKEHCKNG